MSRGSRRRLSEQERDERRRKDRERLERATRELLSSEGWARWVRTRSRFRRYSARNCALLALQCYERGIQPTQIAGFDAWLRLGRCVRKGERGLRIFAPVALKDGEEGDGEEGERRRVLFKPAVVFDVSQTEIIDLAKAAALEPPHQPLTGNSHAHLIAPMMVFAGALGYSVWFETIDGSVGGWCDRRARRIIVDADVCANAQLRTLIHECAHAMGIDYETYTRAQAEVMVDTITLLAASSVGLAVDGETVPYISGWGEDGALSAITEFAETIDTLARRIEKVLLAADQPADRALAAKHA